MDASLYVAPLSAADWAHPAVLALEAACQRSFVVVSQVDTSTVLMRSPIQLALRLPKAPKEIGDLTVVLEQLIAQRGLLNPTSTGFNQAFSTYIASLYPLAGSLVEKLRRNLFGKCGRYQGTLLRGGSFLDHSCTPNAMLDWDSVLLEARVVALRRIKPAEQLTISYVRWPIDSPTIRADLLLRQGFVCGCQCCLEQRFPSASFADIDLRRYTEHCWWCGRPAKQRCSRCHRAYFCSAACQSADWPHHRAVCPRLDPRNVVVVTIKR